jgi:hypothetical protein
MDAVQIHNKEGDFEYWVEVKMGRFGWLRFVEDEDLEFVADMIADPAEDPRQKQLDEAILDEWTRREAQG